MQQLRLRGYLSGRDLHEAIALITDWTLLSLYHLNNLILNLLNILFFQF
jgi:hypothetical protein